MNSLKLIFGQNIRKLREKHGLTMGELAKAVGTTYQTISRIEDGESATDIDTLEKISRQLGVGPAELLMDQDLSDIKRDIIAALASLDEEEAEFIFRGIFSIQSVKPGFKDLLQPKKSKKSS